MLMPLFLTKVFFMPATRKTKSARRPGRPRAAAQADTTALILRSALREFATQGFEGARMSDIAERAGITKPLLHYHFSDKEKLWKAAVANGFEEMMANFQNMPHELKDLDPLSSTKVFLRRYVAFVAHNPELGRIVVIEGYKAGPRARWLLENHVLPMNQFAIAMVAAAQAKGIIKPIAPDQVVAMLNGSINVYFNEIQMRRRLAGDEEDIAIDTDTINQFADHLIDVFASGLLVAT